MAPRLSTQTPGANAPGAQPGICCACTSSSGRGAHAHPGPSRLAALAMALQLECAIWTEDQDFFHTGVATWTTAIVERYLKS
ncbi:MAG: PIN domain-containing protein [Cyanobacteriota bacterium]